LYDIGVLKVLMCCCQKVLLKEDLETATSASALCTLKYNFVSRLNSKFVA